MLPAERLRTAEARVRQACTLLASPSRFNLELCGPLLEGVRQLLVPRDQPGAAGPSDALLRQLTRAGVLARQAAELYQECMRRGTAGTAAYTAKGGPAAGSMPARILAEG
jgi:hypothetical protein